MQNRNDKTPSVFRHLDWTTVIIYLLMVLIGVVSIYAACYNFDNASMFSFEEFSGKQLRWIGLGLILCLVVLLADARVFETYAYPIYAITLVVLFVTIFIAPDTKGSHSWLKLGFVSIQPAEFAKVATALALAKLFNGNNFVLNAKPENYLRVLFIIITPIILILMQKETGSALVYLSLFFVLYREGMTGLMLFAAALSVVIFVVTVKFSGELFMGVTSGEFTIMVLVMLITFVWHNFMNVVQSLLEIYLYGILLLC